MSKIILLELGHTRLKTSYVDKASPFGILMPDAWPYHPDSFDQDIQKQMPHWPSVNEIYLASVASSHLTTLLETTIQASYPDAKLIRIESTAQWQGLHNGYTDPKQLGVDRWLHLMAAYHYWPKQASLIISFGTLTTVDYLSDTGEHRGGMILPSLTQLQQNVCSVLPQVSFQSEPSADSLYGKNTQEAARGGVERLQYDFLNSRLQEFHAEFPQGQVIFTGGASEHWSKRFSEQVTSQPWLSLIGLALLTNHS